ncbi:hypothetical protein K525DRAFT_261803 [Schizophyllum commune Loenen D]|nr:hypothetical protein K525DRAFT_261803 [Schizophyllum commune Loenen D]
MTDMQVDGESDPLLIALDQWVAHYKEGGAKVPRAVTNYVEAYNQFFDRPQHGNPRHAATQSFLEFSEMLRKFVHYVADWEYTLAMYDMHRSHVASAVKHMCLFLDFAVSRGILPKDFHSVDSAREDLLWAQHYVRTLRAFITIRSCYHRAFVYPEVPLNPRKWHIRLLVHDVRWDCILAGRIGFIHDLGFEDDDEQADYSDLPADPIKICIPKAASILLQPTDTICGDLYRIDEDHFIFGDLLNCFPHDVTHKPYGMDVQELLGPDVPLSEPLRDVIRARSLDPAFLVSPETGRAYVVKGSIIPALNPEDDTAQAPFDVEPEAYADAGFPKDLVGEAVSPPFEVYGSDGLPLHHMRRSPDDPEAEEADKVLAHDDVGYRARRARLLSLPSPFGTPARAAYPQGSQILLPGPDLELAQRTGLMDTTSGSASGGTISFLPAGHVAYQIFNMPPLNEDWYKDHDRPFPDEPDEYEDAYEEE